MPTYQEFFSKAACEQIGKIEEEQAKEIVNLLPKEYELKKDEEGEAGEQKEVAPEKHSSYENIMQVIRDLVMILVGERLIVRNPKGELKQENTADELSTRYLDDFKGELEVFDRRYKMTKSGFELKKILAKTVLEVRKAFELKDAEKKEGPASQIPPEAPPAKSKGSKKK